MNKNDIIINVQKHMSERRFSHTKGVVRASRELAVRYGADPEKAELAGWLHDCAKEFSLERMHSIMNYYNEPVGVEISANPALLHGPVGAVIGKYGYGIKDEEILEAIRVHTTGKVNMSLLDKIIFIADYIEETRQFPGVDELRRLALIDLNEAVLAGYNSTIEALIAQKEVIYFKTLLGRNDILKVIKEKEKSR